MRIQLDDAFVRSEDIVAVAKVTEWKIFVYTKHTHVFPVTYNNKAERDEAFEKLKEFV